MIPDRKDIRFFPIFIGATMGVLLEVIATLVDEIVVGNLFSDEAFASVNLIEPYIQFEVFVAYLVTVAAAALIMRAHGAGDRKRMGELFSQAIIVCGLAIALLPILFGTLFGQLALYGIAAGVALGPVTAFALMVVFVCVIKKKSCSIIR